MEINTKQKILYTATSDVHINTFHIPYIKWLQEQGFEVHVAVENRGDVDLSFCDQVFYLPFKRNPLSSGNLKAYKELKKIIESTGYKLVHCHTPAVSVITRLAAINKRKQGTQVLYTAHGFYFFKGSPIKYWLLYFTVEYLISFFTDGIVTINKEDYGSAKSKLHNKKTFYIKGIGVDTEKFQPLEYSDREKKLNELGFTENEFKLIYVAEFIERKNHRFIIESTKILARKIPEIKILFAGKGQTLDEMKELTEQLNLQNKISFLGFREDVPDLIGISDIGISSSKLEGLPMGIAEKMACSLPVVASVERGHKDLIIHGENGFLFPLKSKEQFVGYVEQLYQEPNLRYKMGKEALKKSKEFSIQNSLKDMKEIYNFYLK